jgi:hypothetical protein
MSDIKFVSWEEIFLKAVNETNPEKLAQLVPETELAMSKRQQELYNRSQDDEELSTMSIATEALRVLKRRITKPRLLESSKDNGAQKGHKISKTTNPFLDCNCQK